MESGKISSFLFDSFYANNAQNHYKIGVMAILRLLYVLDYFDFNDFVKPSQFDGLHYDEAEQKIIAEQ